MRRIAFVVSGRYDWTRCQTVVEALNKTPDTRAFIIACGALIDSKHGQSNIITEAGFVIDIEATGCFYEIQPVSGGDLLGMAGDYGILCARLPFTFQDIKPDIVVAMTDRYEALAAASVAALMNITVAHIQGGEVTGTIDESIRHAVTKLAHWHFPATARSKGRIIEMGEKPETVWIFGCPATDLLLRATPELWENNHHYILCLLHPVTTEWDSSYDNARQVVDALSQRGYGRRAVMWVGPNHDAGSTAVIQAITDGGYPIEATLDSKQFIRSMAYADVLVGNSSAGIREACYFGTPVVNIGTRQQGRERGANVIDVPPEKDAIIKAIRTQLDHGRYPLEHIYGDGNAGERIAKVLATAPLPNIQKRITY